MKRRTLQNKRATLRKREGPLIPPNTVLLPKLQLSGGLDKGIRGPLHLFHGRSGTRMVLHSDMVQWPALSFFMLGEEIFDAGECF